MGTTKLSRETTYVVAILILGLLLRILHFHAIVEAEFPKLLVTKGGDMQKYWEWAQHIAAGDWLNRDTYHPYSPWMQNIAPLETWYRWWGGRQIFHQSPAYPYFVASLLAVSNNSVEFVLMVQLLIGAIYPVAVFWLARRLFDSRASLAAAAMTAAYGPFIYHQGVLLRDWLIPITHTLMLLSLLKAQETQRGRWWLAAGMTLGLANLFKPTILLFIPLVLGWIAWQARWIFRLAVLRCTLVVLGVFLCLSPVILRNLLVGVNPLAMSTRAAVTFIIGNAADGDPVGWFIPPPSMKTILERSDGRLVPTMWETLKTYEGDYRRFLQFQFLKLKGLVNPYEIPNSDNFNYGAEISPLLRVTPGFGVVFCLGLGGLLWLRPSGSAHRLFWLFLLATCVSLWFGPIRARYRLPLVPILMIYGSALVIRGYDFFRHREWAPLGKASAICASLAFVQYGPLALTDWHLYLLGNDYLIVAHRYVDEGRYDRAVKEIARWHTRVRTMPGSDDVVIGLSVIEGDYRSLWAKTLLKEGREKEAKQQVAFAATAYAAAPTFSLAHFNLGILYFRLGDRVRARAEFERYLSMEPNSTKATKVRRFLDDLTFDEDTR
jgi:4-amino-4-deoxy-L-arabinose transferase-like glycosyltransferase